jgi:DNA-binding transcriptional ArsR family regulator
MVEKRLDPDCAFALLSNRRRRRLLCLLVRSGEERSLRALADEIVARAEDDGAYRSVYVSLYQSHVPRLAEAGVVDYDETARTVRLARGRRTETLLRIVGIDPIGDRETERRAKWVVTGAAVVAACCGPLAFLDRTWLVPWAILVVALSVVEAYRYAATDRIGPVSDCGDLTMVRDSPADVADDGDHPDQRQEHGRAEREVGG